MFIDVCFPNKNEKDFVNTAKKLNTGGLIFVYDDTNSFQKNFIESTEIKTYSGLLLSEKNRKKDPFDLCFSNTFSLGKNAHKKTVYFHETDNEKHSFHAPLKSINQVIIKDIKKNNAMVALSFHQLLRCKKNPGIFEELTFVVKLCEKYNVKMCIASFARLPTELRSKIDLISVLRFLGMNTKNVKKSFSSLHNFLTP